jgi:hypothetical protein
MSQRVIVSVTTISRRLDSIVDVVGSLLAQSLPPDEVRIAASREGFLVDEGIPPERIPARIQEWVREGKVHWDYTENIGPYRKLIPVLERSVDPSSLIVTADDDTLYPEYWLESLVEEALRNPRSVIAFRCRYIRLSKRGFAPYATWPLVTEAWLRERGAEPVDPLLLFPTGKRGVLYRPGFFPAEVLDREFLSICPLADDVWFRLLAMSNGVGVRPIPPLERFDREFVDVNPSGDVPLWSINTDSQARINNDTQIARVLGYLEGKGRSVLPAQPD